MIDFNKLYITKDGNSLVIDISVKTDRYFNNVYIDNIKIDTEDTFKEGGVSSTPVYSYTVSGNSKTLSLIIKSSEVLASFDDNMLFIYVTTKGTPSSDTPCNMDINPTLACVVDLYKIYQKNIPFIKQINNVCCIPKDYIDFILRLKALEISMKTNNYTMSVDLWKRYFKDTANNSIISNCGCHG